MLGGDERHRATSFVQANSSVHVSASLRLECDTTDQTNEQLLSLQLAHQNLAMQLENERAHRSKLVDHQLAAHFAPMIQKVSNNSAELHLLRKRLLASQANEGALQQQVLSEQAQVQEHCTRISHLEHSMRDLSANHEADRAACKRVQAELDDAIASLAAENAANKLLHKEVHDANAIAKQASRAKQKAERIIEALEATSISYLYMLPALGTQPVEFGLVK